MEVKRREGKGRGGTLMAAAAAAAAAAGGGGGGAAVAGGGSAVALLQPATGTAAGSQIKILEQTKTRGFGISLLFGAMAIMLEKTILPPALLVPTKRTLYAPQPQPQPPTPTPLCHPSAAKRRRGGAQASLARSLACLLLLLLRLVPSLGASLPSGRPEPDGKTGATRLGGSEPSRRGDVQVDRPRRPPVSGAGTERRRGGREPAAARCRGGEPVTARDKAHQGPERGPRTRPARDRSGQGPIISATAEATCPTIGRDKGEAHHLPRPNLAGRGQTVASSHAMRGDKNAAAIGPGPADKEGTWLNRVTDRQAGKRVIKTGNNRERPSSQPGSERV
ncbi:hypothetical protein MPTK1_8g16910 [Marchantia polymorpha subsp. ruderalis]|uniref:Uncharacterized protein n=1 Tax=Marchantia polymorpha TaxID=3197 RepID=A0A2R6X851_MARPO|nr:hypothetical protein MARPO_0030s0025 [Marchantia polymorpha]BBN20162.1 hypothetical protein Mp_8g16910 [Marchantia polymorpha subsp. ruderalis]|eukprot:PTQ42277.1 hypothetical protein MARPO_0030s0025 [Marchantia polymorpha]